MTHIYRKEHLSPEQIALCADALCSDNYFELSEDIRLHLQDCQDCAEEVINVAELSSETQNIKIPVEPIKEESSRKTGKVLQLRKSLYVAIPAAAAAILLAVFIINSQWFTTLSQQEISELTDDIKDEEVQTPEIIMPDEKDIIEEKTIVGEGQEITEPDDTYIDTHTLASFEPNPELEQLYRNVQGTYRGHAIEVISPSEIIYKNELELQWKNPGEQSLYVEIFNNEGIEIHIEATQKEKIILPELEPGLYYWKLISEDFDLYFVGKIISK